MKVTMRKGAGLLMVGALALGLIGSGVGASFTDSATAALNVQVGTFGCQISSPTTGAVVSADKHSVTYEAPLIVSSAPDSALFEFDVTNVGSMPLSVHLTMTTPVAPFSGIGGFPDAVVGPGAVQTYANVGFVWPTLVNTDLGKHATITYTANCGEAPARSTFNKVFTCDYSGTPGSLTLVGVTAPGLATNALPGTWYYSAPGQPSMAHYVIGFNDGQPLPPSSSCPGFVTVHFWKTVDNNFGPIGAPADYALTLLDNSGQVPGNSVTGFNGQTVQMMPGSYTLSESGPGVYQSQQGGCYQDLALMPAAGQGMNTGPIAFVAGQTWYCGFVNQSVPATVVFSNTFVGGPSPSPVFTMHETGGGHVYTSTDGNVVDMVPGTYTVSEDLLSGYTADAGSCSSLLDPTITSGPTITVANGDLWQCGFVNTYVGP